MKSSGRRIVGVQESEFLGAGQGLWTTGFVQAYGAEIELCRLWRNTLIQHSSKTGLKYQSETLPE